MRKIQLIVLMCLISTLTWAQKLTVSGLVSDETGPLPGVSVVVKGSEAGQLVGTITDIDGKFSIVVQSNDVLAVSFMGFQTQEIPVNGQEYLEIVLESEVTELDQVVIVGYGQQRKESSVAAITQTKGEDLLKVGSVTSVSQAIQGMMPGVMSISTTSKPGDDAADILIRGKATWNNASPLTLIDGVEADINDVDMNEIETISVLKDGSATAVYGSKGANGVILVTTKRGLSSKPVISFSSNFGFKQPTSNVEFSDYITAMQLYNEAAANDQNWESLIPESKIAAWKQAYADGNYGPYNDYFPQIDWWDDLIKKVGYQQQYNVNVRGGSSYMKYFASLGYLNDGDIFDTHKNDVYDNEFYYKRYNWRSNFDFFLTKTTTLSADISGKMGYRNQAGYRSGDYGETNFFMRVYQAPTNQFPIKYSDGEWGDSQSGEHNMRMNLDEGGQRTEKTWEANATFKLKQDLSFITKGLRAAGKFSYYANNSYLSNVLITNINGGFANVDVIRYYREYDYSSPLAGGGYDLSKQIRWPDDERQISPVVASYDNYQEHSRRMYYELSANYDRKFGDHEVTALGLFNRYESQSKVDFPSYLESWVGRATYNYKGKYLGEYNVSYMGSEKFAPGKRFGLFQSYSVGYRISEESFIKENIGDVLTNLKLRYSYGEVGNDQGVTRFNYIQTYSSGGNIGLGDDIKQNWGPLYSEGASANPDATWETAIKQNLGAEFSLFNKLQGSVDLFTERREGILSEVFTPVWYGAKAPDGNVGITKNRGIEVELKYNGKIGQDVRYWVKGNFATSENRIVYKQDGANVLQHQKQAGKPIGWQSKYIQTNYYGSVDDLFNYATPNYGVDQSDIVPGDFMYVDYNGDGAIDSQDKVVAEMLTYPLTTGGLSFGFDYKGFSLSALIYAVGKVGKEMDGNILWDFPKNFVKAQPDGLDRWTPEKAETATRPAVHFGSYNQNKQNSSYTFMPASYVRLKNLEVSYQVPAQLVKGLGISKFQIYANGNNLLTFTELDARMDPETKNSQVYPLVKRYNLGFRLTF